MPDFEIPARCPTTVEVKPGCVVTADGCEET